MHVSRRHALISLASAAATSALPACGGGSFVPAPTPLPSPTTTYDVIIVGAGCAGIAAARAALSYGANVLVLEAQNRIGGRAYTDTKTFSEIGFDLGAQFFQACLTGNELYEIAQAQGLTLLDSAGNGPPESLTTSITIGSSPADSLDVAAFGLTAATLKAAILTSGAAIAADPELDVPVSAILPPSITSLPWYLPAASQAIGEIVGATSMSLLDLYVYTNFEPLPFAVPGSDFIVKSGMGTFITSLAKGLPIVTSAPVSSITTGGATVSVTTGSTTYQAKTVIVTAPTNVLAKSNASGGISFSPALPSSYLSAFAGLPLVPIYKALLGFKSSFQFDVPPGTTPAQQPFSVVFPLTTTETATFFPNFWSTNTCEFIANGTLAQTLDAAGNQGAAPMLLAQLETAFPGATAAWDGRITGTNWMSNPYFGGAFSAALPGQYGSRAVIQKPIGNQLWFAGEATSTGGERGLLLAAYRTGLTAGTAAATTALKISGAAARKRGSNV
jgi:monoamine oxidase